MTYIDGMKAENWVEENRPDNGPFIIYYTEDGGASLTDEGCGLRYELFYKDGERADGEHRGWYQSGKLKQIRNYKNGIRDGWQCEWYENGNKLLEKTLIRGLRHGKVVRWHENGQCNWIKTFNRGSRIYCEFWYQNGHKNKEENYKMFNIKEGEWNAWYENGQQKYGVTFKNGKEDGLYTTWYENGQKEIEGNYKDGKEDGKWILWNNNGNVEGRLIQDRVTWIVSGPVCVGKSFFLKNKKDRLSEITNLPPFEGGVEDGAFQAAYVDYLMVKALVKFKNICIHLCIHSLKDVPREHLRWPGWRKVNKLETRKSVIILGVPYSEYKVRVSEHEYELMSCEKLIEVYRMWIEELNRNKTPYLLVESMENYRILEEEDFFRMLK